MAKDKTLLIVLIVLIASLGCAIASAVMTSPENHDNVIHIGGVTFNTTNATDFEGIMVLSDVEISDVVYCSDKGNGDSYVEVIDYSGYEPYENSSGFNDNSSSKGSYKTINGIDVYPGTKVVGVPEEKQVYSAYVQDRNQNIIVMFASPDPYETAKMASTVEFH